MFHLLLVYSGITSICNQLRNVLTGNVTDLVKGVFVNHNRSQRHVKKKTPGLVWWFWLQVWSEGMKPPQQRLMGTGSKQRAFEDKDSRSLCPHSNTAHPRSRLLHRSNTCSSFTRGGAGTRTTTRSLRVVSAGASRAKWPPAHQHDNSPATQPVCTK